MLYRTSGFLNRDVVNLDWAVWAIIAIAAHCSDLFDQRDRGFITLSENGVVAIQHRALLSGERYFRDEELR
jgi:hypothetical protein